MHDTALASVRTRPRELLEETGRWRSGAQRCGRRSVAAGEVGDAAGGVEEIIRRRRCKRRPLTILRDDRTTADRSRSCVTIITPASLSLETAPPTTADLA